MRTLFPDAVIVDVNNINRNKEPAQYEVAWQGLIEQCSAFVFATTNNGWIGAGVWRELLHARKCGIPTHALRANDGTLHQDFFIVERGDTMAMKFRISFVEHDGATLVSL